MMLRLKELKELKTKIQVHEHYRKGVPTPDYKAWKEELESYSAAEARVRKCFEDPDTWVGIFENSDLGHPEAGHRIAFPFSMAQFDAAEIDKTHAPDTKKRIGWRYLLVAKCRTADDAMMWARHGKKPE